MNTARQISFLALMLIIALGLSGCVGKKLSAEEKKEKMLAHLEEKYGEEFVPLSLSGSGHAYSYDRLYAYPKKGVERDSFEVWGTQMEDGSYRISDGYFGIFIKDEYEAVMKSIVAETYKDFKLYTTFGEGVKPEEWLAILNAIKKDPQLTALKIKNGVTGVMYDDNGKVIRDIHGKQIEAGMRVAALSSVDEQVRKV